MVELAVLTGRPLAEIADLDEDEHEVLVQIVKEARQYEAWGSQHEVMACAVEALWAILARLEAGIGVVQLQRTSTPRELERFPRPKWIEDSQRPKEVVTRSVREALGMMGHRGKGE